VEEVPIYKTSTKIKAISSFDELEYVNYNNFIRELGVYSEIQIDLEQGNDETNYNIYTSNTNSFSNFKIINKSYLLNLFIEKISDTKFLTDLIKKSNIIQKKDFKNNYDYNIAVMNIAENFELLSQENILGISWTVNSFTKDKEKWEEFLNFTEKNTNLAIKEFISKKFDSLISNKKLLLKFQMEDLDLLIDENSDNKNIIIIIKNQQRRLKSKMKDLQRLEDSFNLTPIVDFQNFFAGKISSQSTEYIEIINSKNSKLKNLLLVAFMGAIIAVIYFVIKNSLKKIRFSN